MHMQSVALRRLATTSLPRSILPSWHTPKNCRTKSNPDKLFHSTTSRPRTQPPQPPASPFRLTSKPTPAKQPAAQNGLDMDPDLDSDPLARYAPYKPKRQWPPDMTKLSPKHQFRLERKYRRRAALKFARPKWTKGTKLVQWGVIFCMFSRPLLPVSGSVPPCMIRQETNEIVTLVYAVLFMEWENGKSPFDELREMVFAGAKGAFSAPAPAKRIEKD